MLGRNGSAALLIDENGLLSQDFELTLVAFRRIRLCVFHATVNAVSMEW